MAVLKKIKFDNSENPIQFTKVKPASGGVITATGAHTELTDEDNPEYVVDLTIADDGTLVKDNGALKVDTVPAAQVSVADSDELFEAINVEAALAELKDDIADVGGAAKSYTIIEKTTDLPTNVAHRYKLQQTIGEGATAQVTEVGENIDILKDNSLLAAKLSTMDAIWDTENKVIVDGTGKQALVLVYQDADGAAQVIHIDVSAFLNESEFKDGLAVSANGEVSAKLGQGLEFGGETGENQTIKVKVDSTSEKDTQSTPVDFLTVGTNGIKIQGIGAEIDRKIAALDVTTDAAVAGQYVAAIEETDGVVAVKTRANVSEAVLNNYAKDTDDAAIAATDTINQAFSKIEVRIDNNEHTTSAALNEIKTKIDGMDKAASAVAGQVVTTVSETNGIVSETKANVKDLQLGGYVKDTSATRPIGGKDTINTALSKLENAIDAAKAAATTKVEKDTNASHLTLTNSTAADGSVTYTIGESDIASKTALDAEVTRAQNAETAIDGAVGLTKAASGETRTFTPTTNYGGAGTQSAATSVMDNMQKIDTALKAVSDKADAIQYKVSGTTLEFFGMSAHV